MALLVTALWLTHPIQLTSVLYAVQRMTSLSGTFVLLGLLVFVGGRRQLGERPAAAITLMATGVAIGVGIGFFAKQNAVLMPLFALLLERFLFERTMLARRERRLLAGFYFVCVGIPVVLGVALLLMNPQAVLSDYAARDFTLVERLLTQARALVFYLQLLAVPIPSSLGLYHDDFLISTGIFAPPSTAACLALWLVVLCALPFGFRVRAPWAFAVSWYLAGHLLESSVLPLEMVHEHRNYLPALGIVAGAGHYLARLVSAATRSRTTLTATFALLATLLAAITMTRAADWRSPARLTARLANDHPRSYRALTDWVANSPALPRETRQRALARAAQARPDAVYPLAELGREIADRRDPVDDTLALAVIEATRHELESPITTDPARLMEALAHEVSRRLRRYAIGTDTVVSLVALTDCVIGDEPRCRPWKVHLESWLEGAIETQRTTRINMTALHLSMAKLRAVAGDIEGALEHARAVARWTPDSPGYRLLEAELYARLGHVAETRAVLDELEQRLGIVARSQPQFRNLRRFEQRVRAQTGR